MTKRRDKFCCGVVTNAAGSLFRTRVQGQFIKSKIFIGYALRAVRLHWLEYAKAFPLRKLLAGLSMVATSFWIWMERKVAAFGGLFE